MEDDDQQSSNPTKPEEIAVAVQNLAKSYQGNSLQLLGILRLLEGLHREIRDDLFLEALPTNRQALYALLRDIEREGGWPYIPVVKIKELMASLKTDEDLAEKT